MLLANILCSLLSFYSTTKKQLLCVSNTPIILALKFTSTVTQTKFTLRNKVSDQKISTFLFI